jgi:hypothetical protein
VNLTADEFNGAWYLHDSDTERFWTISRQDENLSLVHVEDSDLLKALKEEFCAPPTFTLPGAPGNE